jgi:hypothetical protein
LPTLSTVGDRIFGKIIEAALGAIGAEGKALQFPARGSRPKVASSGVGDTAQRREPLDDERIP